MCTYTNLPNQGIPNSNEYDEGRDSDEQSFLCGLINANHSFLELYIMNIT